MATSDTYSNPYKPDKVFFRKYKSLCRQWLKVYYSHFIYLVLIILTYRQPLPSQNTRIRIHKTCVGPQTCLSGIAVCHSQAVGWSWWCWPATSWGRIPFRIGLGEILLRQKICVIQSYCSINVSSNKVLASFCFITAN